jgi:hypothetical protein
MSQTLQEQANSILITAGNAQPFARKKAKDEQAGTQSADATCEAIPQNNKHLSGKISAFVYRPGDALAATYRFWQKTSLCLP